MRHVYVFKIGIRRTNSIGKIFSAGTDMTDNMPNSEEAICRGEYGVIRSLIRVLEVNKISYLLLTFYHVSNINFIHFEVLFCREE